MSEYSAQYGDISAVPCDRENTGPVVADWSVTRANGEKIGWITDARADNGSEPSEIMPENENAAPYEAFAKSGRYITSAHLNAP